MKTALKFVLWFLGIVHSKKLKSIPAIEVFLNDLLKNNIAFNLDQNSSVLVSPTKDKVIVNHHNTYFQKFAVGKSLSNVKKEAEIYILLHKKPKYFQVSSFTEIDLDTDTVCSFSLSNTDINTQKKENNENLVPALVAFFNYSKNNEVTVASYLDKLKKNKALENVDVNTSYFNEIYTRFGSNTFPLGLVHRDFKPWNVILYQKPLFYDFEETILDGPPLEDLFNFYMDPLIRYKSAQDVIKETLNEKSISNYNSYLKALNINMVYTPFLLIYVLERICFWTAANEKDTSNKYLALLNQINIKN